jgi:hypothetical protein
MIFITFPRSGVNFLSKAIELKTKVRIKYSHETYTDEDIILNIVRDPKESFTSWLTIDDRNIQTSQIKDNTDNLINKYAKNTYIDMYNFLLSKDTIFVNYKDLLEIDRLIEKISEILKIPCDSKPLDFNAALKVYEGKLHNKAYYVTSKDNPKYEEYKKNVEDIDLSECYNLYYQALDRCLKLDN